MDNVVNQTISYESSRVLEKFGAHQYMQIAILLSVQAQPCLMNSFILKLIDIALTFF